MRFDAVCFDVWLRKNSEEHTCSVFSPEDGSRMFLRNTGGHLPFSPEDGSRMFLRNTGGHLPGYRWKAEYSYKEATFFRNNA